MKQRNSNQRAISIARHLFLLVCFVVPATTGNAADWEEGGYVGGTAAEGAVQTVYNFLRHFNYNQYYWAADFQFTYYNNNRVDAMDFAYFCGHGNRWLIRMNDGRLVNLSSAGYSSHRGWGDRDLEFIVFHSCQVVPSPRETSNWWQPWVTEPRDVFDGQHQALGFRSNSSQGTDQDIAYYFGGRMRNSYAVWQSWFDAINRYGNSSEYGAAVMYPPAENDKYGAVSSDPPASHTWLKIWYQY
jgi:hypothetical protein